MCVCIFTQHETCMLPLSSVLLGSQDGILSDKLGGLLVSFSPPASGDVSATQHSVSDSLNLPPAGTEWYAEDFKNRLEKAHGQPMAASGE